MTRLKLILSASITTIALNCCAQQAGLRITSQAVAITNDAKHKISILLGDTTVRLDTFSLAPKAVWHSPNYQNDPVIKVQTDSYIATYLLKRGDSFMIFWNKKRKYWDVKKIRNR
jgi:hypothetical protein